MTEAEITIRNQSGLHVRSAGVFVKLAARFRSHISVCHEDTEVNGTSILGLIGLAAEAGSTLKVRAEGPDEQEAVTALKELVENKFGFTEEP